MLQIQFLVLKGLNQRYNTVVTCLLNAKKVGQNFPHSKMFYCLEKKKSKFVMYNAHLETVDKNIFLTTCVII